MLLKGVLGQLLFIIERLYSPPSFNLLTRKMLTCSFKGEMVITKCGFQRNVCDLNHGIMDMNLECASLPDKDEQFISAFKIP